MKTRGYIKLLNTRNSESESVMELNILPGERTPWHYHTLFSETFEILSGMLDVGVGQNTYHLKPGDMATIKPKEKHYYRNVTQEECVVKATLRPGNTNFEKSLFILKGLAEDGLASSAGTPKRFSDLAIFIYLNNSKMVGFQKIAEPIFSYAAKIAIKNGRLDELIAKYWKEKI